MPGIGHLPAKPDDLIALHIQFFLTGRGLTFNLKHPLEFLRAGQVQCRTSKTPKAASCCSQHHLPLWVETSGGSFLPTWKQPDPGDGWLGLLAAKIRYSHSGTAWLFLLRGGAQREGMMDEKWENLWESLHLVCDPLMDDIGLDELDCAQMWNFKKMNLTLSGRFCPGKSKGQSWALSVTSRCVCSVSLTEHLLCICWSPFSTLNSGSSVHPQCPSSISNYL